ncbi:hypothetical protein GCM10022403_041800 [Streptomyces coacervatus]|uniref:PE-PGRS family protein n=1 Tax=Streptomyces coacervatus TaxID=647381 RepID=A0ABP7HVK1_9ACTN|nr:hypothetical protein [Streptomyces coacervatus]MDF2267233.1 hypothetical protein [Streptomyces coacervatus]
MADRYPLVEQREFGRAGKRVGFLARRQARSDDELPRLAPHEVRVFRVGADYIEDSGQLRPDHGMVVEATSVTVVDRSVGVPVVVEMRIPSAEAGDFTLRTTFHCTVTDARAVVRDGVTDVEALLLGYLRSVPGLAEEGGDLGITDSALVRRRIDARLTAYQEMQPPQVSGLRALPGAVDVLTPEELAAHVREVEEARRRRDKERFEEELALEKARADSEMELLREQHRQELERLRMSYERDSSAVGQQHDLTLKAQKNRFDRDQVTEDLRVLRDDPAAAEVLAHHREDAGPLAERMREDEQRRYEREMELARLEQEELERRNAVEWEQQRFRLERGDRIRESHRQDRREDEAARREDMHMLRNEQREWREKMLSAEHDLKKQAIARGHGDSSHVDMDDLIKVNSAQYAPQALEQGAQQVKVERADRPAEADVVDADGEGKDGDGKDSDLGPGLMEENA